jgi:hypothetical protein
METDTNFSEANGDGASPARSSAPTSKALSEAAAAADFPALLEILKNLPDSRPEEVADARKLIADPHYPSQYTQKILAGLLAVQLTSGTDSLPT